MNLRSATSADERDWDAYVLGRPEGVAYQLFAWKKAVERAYGFRCPYLLAEEDGELRGVLPLVHLRLPLTRGKLVSLPYCDLAGPLADSDEVSAALLERALSLAEEVGAKGVEIRNGSRYPAPSPRLESEPETRNSEPGTRKKVRMLLSLPKTSDALLASFPSKLRSQIRKPERDGLRAVMGGAELVDEFYAVLAENMRDLGSPVHAKAWIRSVVEGYGGRARVGVVRAAGGVPAAGGIVLCHDRAVSMPWASALRRHNRLNPNMLLYWMFLKFASDGGYEVFDFGRSTAGEGTYRFKEQWGAKPMPLRWVRVEREGFEIESATRPGSGRFRTAAETAIRALPVSTATLLGTIFRKYVSL
jgi:FemAB-related protein (PEP-CTERM system-associated)